MRNAIIIHGTSDKDEYYSFEYPTASNSHWIPWLSKQLIVKDILAIAIEMPNSYWPDYGVWRKELERFDIGPETLLVGHSCGGGFLLRWLSEGDIKVGKVILVAPWLDPQKEKNEAFFDFTIDTKLLNSVESLHVISSDNDMESIQQSLLTIKSALPGASYHNLSGKGHFTRADLGTEEFPELFEICLAS